VAALSALIATLYREPRLEPIASCQGYGYWALVFRLITSAAYVACGAWFVCKWRPGLPNLDDEVRSMIRFGLHVVSFSATYTFARAVDRIGLGLFYPPDAIGYYQNATTLYDNFIYSALHQLRTVGSTSLSKLQADPAALRQKYEGALSAVAFFVMPVAAILSVTAKDVTVLLLGERWRAAGVLLSIIALRGIFQVIENSQGWLDISLGRADRWRNWGLSAQLAAVLVGLPFGPESVAVASVITSALIAVPSINYAGRPIGASAALVIRCEPTIGRRHRSVGNRLGTANDAAG
jgi:PST family polysaccharide transporter